MNAELDVRSLSKLEKLRLIETLWADLALDDADIISPHWHQNALDEAKQLHSKGKAFFPIERCQGAYPRHSICRVKIRILDIAERDLQSGFFFMRPSSPASESISLIQFIQKSTPFYSLQGFTSRSSVTIGRFAEDFPTRFTIA